MPDVRPDPKPVTEGGIGRKKPRRAWRTRGRIMATPEQWAAIREAKLIGQPCRLFSVNETIHGGPLQLHHLVGRSAGGDDVEDNCVPLCVLCHRGVEMNMQAHLRMLAARLTDGEYAYIIGKLGEGGPGRLFGV